jgi:signal transduction histidine kinase
VSGIDPPFWRVISVFRWLSLGYVTAVNVADLHNVAHPLAAVLLLAGMLLWTVIATIAYSRPELRQWPLLITDLAVAAAAVLATRLVESADRIAAGEPTFPQMWVAAALVAWAVCWQRRGGLVAAGVLAVADVIERGALSSDTAKGIVILLLIGVVVGYGVGLVRRAQAALAEAIRIQGATRERERLSRGIHDSVLQVLALVQRRGAEIGGDAAELGRLAGEQERALRGLVSVSPERVPPGDRVDLRQSISTTAAGSHLHLSAPATSVLVTEHQAGELTAAVAAAVHNVARHVGEDADVWVLVEDEGEAVVVTVRDDGPGIPPGRLEQAAAEGRLGVAQSLCGRMHDLGGSARITSVAGEGTEVELRVPR